MLFKKKNKDSKKWGLWIKWDGHGEETFWYETEAKRDKAYNSAYRDNKVLDLKKTKRS